MKNIDELTDLDLEKIQTLGELYDLYQGSCETLNLVLASLNEAQKEYEAAKEKKYNDYILLKEAMKKLVFL